MQYDRRGVSLYLRELVGVYAALPALLGALTDRQVVPSAYERSSLNVKAVLDQGDGQGWHRDTNPLTALLYLTFFSRLPSDAERQLAVKHFAANTNRQQAVEDYAWSLLNTVEFVFNH